jgi:hypothetical protein
MNAEKKGKSKMGAISEDSAVSGVYQSEITEMSENSQALFNNVCQY